MAPLPLSASCGLELEPPRYDRGADRSSCSGRPFWDAPSQLLHSIAANLFSGVPYPLNCRRNQGGGREAQPVLGSSPYFCGASSSQCSAGACTGTPILLPFYHSFARDNHRLDLSGPSSGVRNLPTSVRVDGIGLGSNGRGPAFVGQVFSMCDPSGTGLMAVSTRFDIPFLSKRMPESIRKLLAVFSDKDSNDPVFRFFMDLGDAVSYVKKLNVPTGMVGACRLDIAYEHFKKKPHMFQFVPDKKQVKAANKLLKDVSHRSGKRKLDGVPVFTAQNLNIAIATNNGIKWYTPYFFDKNLLDNILEASMDQHFHALIQNRHRQRRRDVLDDNMATEAFEENGESLFDPPEVQELLDEMGHPGITLNVVSKAAGIQFLDVVDKVLLGNKWLRKATGIQPKFPYLVDSFESRSASSFLKRESLTVAGDSEYGGNHTGTQLCPPEYTPSECASIQNNRKLNNGSPSPISKWFRNPWWTQPQGNFPDHQVDLDRRQSQANEQFVENVSHPLLPKITMVGISTSDGGQISKASLKKAMEELTRELEQSNKGASKVNEDKDPLFVANVGDYSSITRMSSR